MAELSVPKDLPKMEYRRLGRSGLQVSAISLGGWITFGGHVNDGETPDNIIRSPPPLTMTLLTPYTEKTFACMKAAHDSGINFFDTAEIYSNGESERLMGRAIKHFNWKRNSIVVSAKIYWGSAFSDTPINNIGLSRKHIIEGLDASLERLGLDYVDIV